MKKWEVEQGEGRFSAEVAFPALEDMPDQPLQAMVIRFMLGCVGEKQGI